MITLEEAKKKALKQDKTVNTCLEYRDAYVFFKDEKTDTPKEDAEIVIMKKDGSIKTFMSFIMNTTNTSSPKKIKL